jgi:transcriptional regulator with XRE-family HTH domain
MERKELLHQESYWITKIQLDLYGQIDQYMKDNDLNKTQFAEKLGVTKGYLSQVLNGDFDHKLSRLIKLAMAIGKVPMVEFKNLNEVIETDCHDFIAFYKQFVLSKKDLFLNTEFSKSNREPDIKVNPKTEGDKPMVFNFS